MIELAVRSDTERFFNTAVRLAKIMDMDLQVVSRQDPTVLQAAALPMVQEVCLWTAREQKLSTARLTRSIRIQVRQAKARLAKIAEREAVSCSFISSPDHIISKEGGRAGGYCIRWIGGRGLSTQSDAYPVCALDSGDSTGKACLQQAALFSSRMQRPLKVYSLSEHSMPGHDIGNPGQWLQWAQTLPCFVLFMPESVLVNYPKPDLLGRIPFPVLLV